MVCLWLDPLWFNWCFSSALALRVCTSCRETTSLFHHTDFLTNSPLPLPPSPLLCIFLLQTARKRWTWGCSCFACFCSFTSHPCYIIFNRYPVVRSDIHLPELWPLFSDCFIFHSFNMCFMYMSLLVYFSLDTIYRLQSVIVAHQEHHH